MLHVPLKVTEPDDDIASSEPGFVYHLPSATLATGLWRLENNRLMLVDRSFSSHVGFTHSLVSLGQGKHKSRTYRQWGWELEGENSLAPGKGQLKVDQGTRLRVRNGHGWCLPCVGVSGLGGLMIPTPMSISHGSPFTDCMVGQAEMPGWRDGSLCFMQGGNTKAQRSSPAWYYLS